MMVETCKVYLEIRSLSLSSAIFKSEQGHETYFNQARRK